MLAELLGEERLCRDDLLEDRAAAGQPDPLGLLVGGNGLRGPREAVDPANDPLVDALGLGGHRVVLVVQGEVVEDGFLVLIHPPDAVLHDDGDLVGVGRIVGDAVGNRAGVQDAMAVLVLQTLARQRAPPGRTAAQEPLAARVAEGPDEIAHALEAEHGIVDEEGNHLQPVIDVRGAGGRERRHGAGLGDAFLENLAVLRFLVVEEHFRIVRLVELALAGVDSELAEQRLHAEGAGLVGDDGHHALAELRPVDDDDAGVARTRAFGAAQPFLLDRSDPGALGVA